MSSGEVLKAEKDFSKEADAQIPEAEKLGKSNPQAAIDQLLPLEKKTRQASDLASTSRVIIAIVTIAKNANDWNLMNEQVLLLSKKHGQLKQATTKMVQTVMTFLDDTPNLETKLSVIETLRTVTEGKIFVEVERARVTRILSDIKKEQGDINAATDILCELQVETFGSMTRREKTEFILQQVALCIEKGEWTQAGILSRKISKKYFQRRPKKTPEQLAKDQKEREEKEKTRSADDPPIEPEDDVTDLKLSTTSNRSFWRSTTTSTSRPASTTDRCWTQKPSRRTPRSSKRSSNASSTSSSSHHTITSSPISSTASSATHATR